MTSLGHRLGDIRAEHDSAMLDSAFYETSDYGALVESSDRCVVVGRRGTGKSALVYRLRKFWELESRTRVFTIIPTDAQIIGIREMLAQFGHTYSHLQAGAKLAWKYALLAEVFSHLASHYKFSKCIEQEVLGAPIKEWGNTHDNISLKLRKFLSRTIDTESSSQMRIADFAEVTEHSRLNDLLGSALVDSKLKVILLIDRLDEGYFPDNVGVGLVDGITQAVIDLNSQHCPHFKAYIFLRDNIYRAIADSTLAISGCRSHLIEQAFKELGRN